jgi:hypothetical protein
MKASNILAASLLTACACAAPFTGTRADAILLDSISLIQGQQSFTDALNVASPGTLTMTLSSIPWMDTISNLTGFVSTDSGVVGTTMGAGTESFNIESAGTVYAHWFGDAQGSYDIGVLGVKISFLPSVVTPVPLPASLLLMLSGLGVLFGWQRRADPQAAEG